MDANLNFVVLPVRRMDEAPLVEFELSHEMASFCGNARRNTVDYVGIVQFGTAIRANVGAEEALLAANVAFVSPVTSSSFRGTVWHNLLDCNARWQECLGYNIQRDVYIARCISGFRPCLLHHFRRRSDNVSSSAPKRRPDAIRLFGCKRGHSLASCR